MAVVTFRILEGADRGQVFESLATPVTIGREEGNSIQLNDERVSRFHVKIQEDHEKLILTDLESTNGTKVNGEDIKLRVLRYGDIIGLGRSLLLYGTREQIAQRLAELRGHLQAGTLGPEDLERVPTSQSLDFDVNWGDNLALQTALHMLPPPEIPDRLSPGQAAQLFEILEYFHLRLRDLIDAVEIKDEGQRIILGARPWQNVLDIQSRLAGYLRTIGQPGEEPPGED